MDIQESSNTSGESAAPPSDSAATSPAPDVAADQSAAASQASEVAASSADSGARSFDDPLDALYDKFQSDSARSDEPEAAPATIDQPKQEESEVDEGQETREEEEPIATEPDPLADEPSIPTRDEINANHARAPRAIRELAADMAERAKAGDDAISSIGGKEGLEVAQAIIPHLFSAEVTDENCNAIFNGIADTNPAALARMSQMFVEHALSVPEFADRQLEEAFGEGYNAERLRELVELDTQGLIDVNALREDLGAIRQPTARERELEAAVKERDEQIKQLTGDSKDATRREEQRLTDTVEQTVSEIVMNRVTPIAENIGWKGEGLLARLGKLAMAELKADVKSAPEYNEIMALAEAGNAYRDGQPTRLMRAKLDAVGRRSEANFKRTVRELRPVLEILAGKQKTSAAPPQDDPPSEQTGRSGDPSRSDAPPPPRKQPETASQKTTQEILDEKYRQFTNASRDGQAFSGRRGR